MQEISEDRFQQLEVKIDAIRESVEKTRRYFQITMWVTVFFLVAPLVASVFILPLFLSSYLGSFELPSDAESQSQIQLLRELLE